MNNKTQAFSWKFLEFWKTFLYLISWAWQLLNIYRFLCWRSMVILKDVIFLYCILMTYCQYLEDLPNTVNHCFPDDQCMILQIPCLGKKSIQSTLERPLDFNINRIWKAYWYGCCTFHNLSSLGIISKNIQIYLEKLLICLPTIYLYKDFLHIVLTKTTD